MKLFYEGKKLDANFFCNSDKKAVATPVATTLLWILETLKSNEYLVKYNMESPKALYYVLCSFPGPRMV